MRCAEGDFGTAATGLKLLCVQPPAGQPHCNARLLLLLLLLLLLRPDGHAGSIDLNKQPSPGCCGLAAVPLCRLCSKLITWRIRCCC
jgi:hypothetical protein